MVAEHGPQGGPVLVVVGAGLEDPVVVLEDLGAVEDRVAGMALGVRMMLETFKAL
jgi:hypothetical protein